MDSLRSGWIRGPVCLRPVPEAIPGRLSRNFTRKMALRALQTKGADTLFQRRILTLAAVAVEQAGCGGAE